MKWLGLDYDEVVFQSDNLKVYQDIAFCLISAGYAHKTENDAVVFDLPDNFPTYWEDTVAGKIEINERDVEVTKSMVLLKSDGFPTYNFASVVDDIVYRIDRVVRGVDHINNTSKQVILYEAICKTLKGTLHREIMLPTYTHVGLVNFKGNKLSKRTGSKGVLDYREEGIHPEALLNLMLRMGWSPKDPQFDSKYKFVDKEMAKGMILTEGSFNASPSNFDEGKLAYYGKKYRARDKQNSIT
jgi:glutamyl-tRNA synthetase